MRVLPLLLLLVVAAAAAERSCRDGGCDDADDEGAEKYSRERNQPGDLRGQMAVLQTALLQLMKDPYNPDVLRSSLAELALFADTPDGKQFLDKFGDVMGGEAGGAAGAMVRKLFTSVLSGRVDLSQLMSKGINAGTLASLAGGLLGKDGGGGNGMKTEDLVPLLQNFMQVIKDEQASPFLLDRLNDAFKDTMSEEQLRKFERTAAGVLGGIRAASGTDDADVVYDQGALDTFESFLQDFVDEQEWDWSRTGPTFMKEIKKVMRLFAGSEDQIGRLLPSLMEAIADEKPTRAELNEIITNFGGVLGNVVKKDNAEPEFVKLLLDKLKTPLEKPSADFSKDNEKTEAKVEVKIETVEKRSDTSNEEEDDKQKEKAETKTETKTEDKKAAKVTITVDEALKKAEGVLDNVPDLSKLMGSLESIGSDPKAMQLIMMRLAAGGGGGGFDLKEMANMVPEVEGLEEITTYLSQIQNSKDEKEVAGHFHAVMDAVGDAFSLLKSEDIRRAAIEQALPYIRMAHDFLKDPLALLKIQMGVTSLASMYDTSVSKLIDMATPHVEDTVAALGIQLDFKSFCDDTHKFLLKVYNEVYQSPKSVFKTLSGKKEDNYILDTVDHSVGEPLILAYSAYKQIRRKPECLLQSLCKANREAKDTDAGSYGIRSSVTKGTSRLFGLLLASAEHDIDSVVHEQVAEAVSEGQEEGNCEKLYPGECEEDDDDLEISF